MNTTIDVYFSIRGIELTPKYISNYLDLEPSAFCVKGVSKRKKQTPAIENVWTFKLPCSKNDSMEKQMQAIVEVLLPLKSKLIAISDQCFFDIECVIHLSGKATTPIINFKTNVIKFFAEIDAELGVEVFA